MQAEAAGRHMVSGKMDSLSEPDRTAFPILGFTRYALFTVMMGLNRKYRRPASFLDSCHGFPSPPNLRRPTFMKSKSSCWRELTYELLEIHVRIPLL